ncbi:MAG: hypothetical protein K6E40_07585 [Desulfovibrio sp.]|nr:hypothetical protein [Desulfovibrio sp.]
MHKIYVILFCFVFIFFSNICTSYSAGYEKTLWRFAEKHEGGDIEPSEFCYVTFGSKNVLMHWITPAEPESVDIFTITKQSGNNFCAKAIDAYEVDRENDKLEKSTPSRDAICGSFSGGKLVIKDWITLHKIDGDLRRAFPEALLNRYAR